MTLEWKDEYATGIGIIDFDHKTLFDITNDLRDVIDSPEDGTAIETTVKRLVDYIEYHFHREERIFREAHFPNAEKHCEKHREIEKTMRNIAIKYQKDPALIDSTELLSFLEQWLRKHIAKSDMEYVPYVLENHGR